LYVGITTEIRGICAPEVLKWGKKVADDVMVDRRSAILPAILLALAVLPAAAQAAPKLTWAPPALEDPTTVAVTPTNRILRLDPARDYVVEMPDTPLTGAGGLSISGGHDVVLIGGEIRIDRDPAETAVPTIQQRRGLVLANQTGTIHIEGLKLTGDDLNEAIDLSEPLGATVQLENVRVDGMTSRDPVGFTDGHPDLIQSWAGPGKLRVDRFTGITNYQGFYLAPQEIGTPQPLTELDLRNVNIVGTATSTYLLWAGSPLLPSISEVWVKPRAGRLPEQSLWPSPAAWPGVQIGQPPSFVNAWSVGTVYRSPGYLPASSGRR
jgi:hypothetical protein